ncbi:hypothetical protein JVT61DRAFT_2816 [Boletus reticuloceps]|uniref:Uncharacterized protein n=1 Tax=Boletus reticuloceps TaxID=495285 RepID=A0A8I2YPQ3_9AGAM|nr:hypothetical protein JVT61DRAFT_2816 [Boletus reticuloceps]
MNAGGIRLVQDGSPKPSRPYPNQDAEVTVRDSFVFGEELRSDLREDEEGEPFIPSPPETISYRLGSEANSESIDSSPKPPVLPISFFTSTTSRIQGEKGTYDRNAGQSTIAVQHRRYEVGSSRGGVPKRVRFARLPARTTTSPAVETRRLMVAVKSKSGNAQGHLLQIQRSHREARDRLLDFMEDEFEDYKRFCGEYFEGLEQEIDRLQRELEASAAEITRLEQELAKIQHPDESWYSTESDSESEINDSVLNRTDRAVTNLTTMGHPTIGREGNMSPGRSKVESSRGVVRREAAFHHEAPIRTVASADETWRLMVAVKSKSEDARERLLQIQRLHREATERLLDFMDDEFEDYKRFCEDHFKALEEEIERLQRELDASVAEITRLEQEVAKIRHESWRFTGLSRAPSVETTRLPVPPSPSGVMVEETLAAMEQSYRRKTDHMLRIMKARLEEHMQHERIHEEQLKDLQTENQEFVLCVSALASENAVLKTQLASLVVTRAGHALPHGEVDASTGTAAIAAIVAIITTITTRIEQWKDGVIGDEGQATISRMELDQLLLDLSNTSSQITELQQDFAELSEVRNQLHVTSSLLAAKDSNLNAVVVQLKNTIVALRRDNEKLRNDNSLASTRVAELSRNHDSLLVDLQLARDQLQFRESSIEESDGAIASRTAEATQLRRSDVEKTKQIAILREDHAKLQRETSFQIAELRKRYEARCKELDSVLNELRDNKTLVVEKDHTIVALNNEVEKWKHSDATKTEQLDAERRDKEKLQQNLPASSRIVALQQRCDTQSKEIISLSNELYTKVSLLAEQEHSISPLTTEREQARRRLAVKEELVEIARQDAEQFRQKFFFAWDQKTSLQKLFDSRLVELQNLRIELHQLRFFITGPHNATPYITHALEEEEKKVEVLRRDLATVTSRNNDLQSKIRAIIDDFAPKSSQYEDAIASLTVQINQLRDTVADKTKRIEKLQQESPISTSQLQDRHKALSDELASVSNKLVISIASNEEKDCKLTAFMDEVVGLKRINSLGDERIVAASKQVEDLRLELTRSRSRIAELQHDNQTQLTELDTLRNRLKAMASSGDATISSLTTQVEERKGLCTTEGEELMTARGERNQLRHERDTSSSRFAELQQELTSQTKRWQQLDAPNSVELTTARAELEQLRHELDTSSSQIAESEQELAAKTAELTLTRAELEKLRRDPSTSSSQIEDYQVQLIELASQVERLKYSNTTKEEELFPMRKKLKQPQRDLDPSSSQNTDLRQSRGLKFPPVHRREPQPDGGVRHVTAHADTRMAKILLKLNTEVQQSTALNIKKCTRYLSSLDDEVDANATTGRCSVTASKCLRRSFLIFLLTFPPLSGCVISLVTLHCFHFLSVL